MANIKSAKKRVLTSATKHDRNRSVRAAIKTKVTRVRRLLDTGDAEPADHLKLAVSSLDRAAEKGILHANNAARRKSRLMKAVARAQALAADPEAKARAAAEAKAHAKGTSKNRGKTTAARKAAAKKTASKGTTSRSK
ncbi:MAG: small subunit ribosomal protein [Chloroflexota bacterium]|jgi:small subunit ribosomal protein S20|nr:small subunit ribosomal protein [Chloroflexota bacterium]